MALPDPGDPFPILPLTHADGRPADAPRGETLYAFFKTSCPTSELTWPYLERLRRIGDGALSVLAVSQDDPATTERFNQRTGAKMPTLYDAPPWRASEALGMTTVPALFLVGADGRVRETALGFQKAKMEELARHAAALAGRPSEPLFRPEENVPPIRPG